MWLFPISEVSCTDTARRGGGRRRARPIDYGRNTTGHGRHVTDRPMGNNWDKMRNDPRISEKHIRALKQQEKWLAHETMKTPAPDPKPLVPSLNLSASDAGNMPLQPSPVIPEPEPDVMPQGSSSPIPKRDKSGAPKKYSVRRPYNWKNIQSNVRY